MASDRLLAPLVAAVLFFGAATAHAEPTPQQKELARELMQKGREAREGHDLAGALQSFRAADEIMHVPTTGFEVARSQVDLGQLVEAHETLLRVMRSPEEDGEPQAFKDARGYAKELDDQLGPRIPQLRVRIEGGTSPAVAIDGVAIPADALIVPYKVDPGDHVVEAHDAAGAAAKESVHLNEKDTRDVVLHLAGAPATAAAPAPDAAPSAGTPPPATAEAPATKPRFTTLTWIGFGVGAAGLVAGGITGAMALSDKSTLDSSCHGTRCGPSTYSTLDSASTLATVSTISFIVAGAGAAVGVASLFFFHGDPQPAPASGGVRVTPVVGLGALGARGTF